MYTTHFRTRGFASKARNNLLIIFSVMVSRERKLESFSLVVREFSHPVAFKLKNLSDNAECYLSFRTVNTYMDYFATEK